MNHADLSTLIEAAKAVLWIKDNWEWFGLGLAVFVALQVVVLIQGKK